MALTLLLVILAPVVVVLTLSDLRLTFLLYHGVVCLTLPLVHSLATGRGLRGHASLLGLDRGTRRDIVEGLATGLVLGGGTVAVFVGAGESLLTPGRVTTALAGWGVGPDARTGMVAFMLLANGPAEELFWRGWVHGRLARTMPRSVVLGLTAAAYASYHVVTLRALLPGAAPAMLAFAGVALAGVWWTWRRERCANVWVPLLGHGGATVGYMAVYLMLG